jgi:hypothetical protein
MPYRPWGLLHWVLEKCPPHNWSMIGCLSPEERSLSVWTQLRSINRLQQTRLALIEDHESRFTAATKVKIESRKAEFALSGGNFDRDCRVYRLLARHSEIVSFVDEAVGDSAANVLIDISSLPKRFFFPAVRRLLLRTSIENLIVTYTRPVSYTSENLAENFEPLQNLPLFPERYPEQTPKLIVVGVGYSIMGLPAHLEHYGHDVQVKLIFPFPPGPPSFERNWQVTMALAKGVKPELLTIAPISGHDVTDVFDHIVTWTNNGRNPAAFAPYGPKPMSLAMCIFASLKDAPVQYTQPTAYNPEYSTGVSIVDDRPEIYAYCLRLKGKDLYTVP